MCLTMVTLGMMVTGFSTLSRPGTRRTTRRLVRMASSTPRRSSRGRGSCTEPGLHARPSPTWTPVSMWSRRIKERRYCADIATIHICILWLSYIFPLRTLVQYCFHRTDNKFSSCFYITSTWLRFLKHTNVASAVQISNPQWTKLPEETIKEK